MTPWPNKERDEATRSSALVNQDYQEAEQSRKGSGHRGDQGLGASCVIGSREWNLTDPCPHLRDEGNATGQTELP